MTEEYISQTYTDPNERRRLTLELLKYEMQTLTERIQDLSFTRKIEDASKSPLMSEGESALLDTQIVYLSRIKEIVRLRINALKNHLDGEKPMSNV